MLRTEGTNLANISSGSAKNFAQAKSRFTRAVRRRAPSLGKNMSQPDDRLRTRSSSREMFILEPELDDCVIIAFLELITDEKQTDDSCMPSWEDPVSVFFSVTKPEIQTSLYVRRLVRYAQCSRAAFVIGMVYLRRLEESNSKLAITPFNMHRLLITSLMLAAKNVDDRCYSNAHYARVGGIATVREVNRLELQMLALLRYNIFVSPEEYYYFVDCLKQKRIPRSPTHISRVHEVFPAEARRSSQVGTPALSGSRRSSGVDSKEEKTEPPIAMRVDMSRTYDFEAPSDHFQVLPIAHTPLGSAIENL